MNGKLHQKNISKAFQISLPQIIEILIPFVLGILAIIAHARFRSHINLPGHHGLEFMALLLIAYSCCSSKWSMILFSLGIAAFAYVPFLGFKSPLVAIVYIIPGIVFGRLNRFSFKDKNKVVFIATIGGFSYACIPIIRFIFGAITGIMHKSLMIKPVITIFFFFIFGLLGTLIGLGIYRLAKKILKKYKI